MAIPPVSRGSRRNARELVRLLRGKAPKAEETEEKAAKPSAPVRVGRWLSLAETSPDHVAASKEAAERLARRQMACQCLGILCASSVRVDDADESAPFNSRATRLQDRSRLLVA